MWFGTSKNNFPYQIEQTIVHFHINRLLHKIIQTLLNWNKTRTFSIVGPPK